MTSSGTTSAGSQQVSETLDDIPEFGVAIARNPAFEAMTTTTLPTLPTTATTTATATATTIATDPPRNNSTKRDNQFSTNENINVNTHVSVNSHMNVNVNVNSQMNVNRNVNPTVPRRRRGGRLAREKSVFVGGRDEVAKVVRQSAAVDIETGAPESKAFTVEEIHQAHQTPMDPRQRWRQSFLEQFGITSHNIDEDDQEEEQKQQQQLKQQQASSPLHPEPVKQFRLKSKEVGNRNCIERWIAPSDHESTDFSSALATYLNWSFRTSFIALIWQLMILYWIITTLFAIAFAIIADYQPECIIVAGGVYVTSKGSYFDLYHLSWTTFSTVGYGVVYPTVYASNHSNCYLINMFTALEAFTGILYAATAAAIVYGKVARLQSCANVLFSDPILVRYGNGLLHSGMTEDSMDKSAAAKVSDGNMSEIPFPVLEFRVINCMHHKLGGEVVNCVMHCVASIKTDHASDQIRIATNPRTRYRIRQPTLPTQAKIIGGIANTLVVNPVNQYLLNPINKNVINPISKNLVTPMAQSLSDNVLNPVARNLNMMVQTRSNEDIHLKDSYDPDVDKCSNGMKQNESLFNPRASIIDEGSNLVPQRIYSTLELEMPSHPFFKRTWSIRHVLNTHSPLLTQEARDQIEANHGCWPQSLNCYQKLRELIHFHEIIVCFTGTANASGSRVYKQKVYAFDDLNIGYTFANVLHRDERGRLQVDDRLLNDVKEQYGGGGQPFRTVEDGWIDNAAKMVETVAVAGDSLAVATVTTTNNVVSGTVDLIESGATKAGKHIARQVSAFKSSESLPLPFKRKNSQD